MIKEGIMVLADKIEDITKSTLKVFRCPLEECFPASSSDVVEIDGKEYLMSIDVRLKELK